jgi:predicted nucleic acid-binding protein
MRIACNLRHYMRAATLRARRSSIRLTDPVHLATAQVLSCGLFVGHDRRLLTLDGLRMLAVNPFTLDDIRESTPS